MGITENQRLVLKLVSGLLDYPHHPEFWERIEERMCLADELDSKLAHVFRRFQGYASLDLEKLYVATFDFDDKASLYVSAHEMEDSRGQVLIELTELYRQKGYEVPENLLADYLPLLLEFMAIHPESISPDRCERIAGVSQEIAKHLDVANPYQALFEMVPEALGTMSPAAVLRPEENPDLLDLPYPLDYQHGQHILTKRGAP